MAPNFLPPQTLCMQNDGCQPPFSRYGTHMFSAERTLLIADRQRAIPLGSLVGGFSMICIHSNNAAQKCCVSLSRYTLLARASCRMEGGDSISDHSVPTYLPSTYPFLVLGYYQSRVKFIAYPYQFIRAAFSTENLTIYFPSHQLPLPTYLCKTHIIRTRMRCQ